MKTLLLIALAILPAFSQGAYTAGANSVTSVTIQQTATSSVNAIGTFAIIYCAAATTVTASWNGTAASATAFTPKRGPNTLRSSTLTAYSSSDVGAGTTGETYDVPAASPYKLDLTANGLGVRLGPGTTTRNFTLTTGGSCRITIAWIEQ